MKTNEVHESLIGKRAKTLFDGKDVNGTIIEIVSIKCSTYNRETNMYNGPEVECSRGVKIKLDKPVMMYSGDFNTEAWWQDTLECTARVHDDWGNLQYVELI